MSVILNIECNSVQFIVKFFRTFVIPNHVQVNCYKVINLNVKPGTS